MLPVLTFYHPSGGDDDYVSFRIAVNFTAGVNAVSFPVEIIEDDVAECPEEFFLDLEIPPAAVAMDVMKGSPDSATIIITDEDSEYCSNALLYNINCTTHCAWVKTGNGDFTTKCANVREEFANIRISDWYWH